MRALVTISLVIGILSLVIPASAVTVTVQMDGAVQVLKAADGSALAAGNAIQIISGSGGAIHAPKTDGSPDGGDALIWSGAVGEGGVGSGAFIKAFAGSQSLADGSRIYVRSWNGASVSSAAYYGDSSLSPILVPGEPPLPVSWAVPSFSITTAAVPLAPATVLSTPEIASLSPISGLTGTKIVIAGSKFGTDPGSGNRSSASNNVSLGWDSSWVKVADTFVESWSDTRIAFTLPSGVIPSDYTSILIRAAASGQNSNRMAFTVIRDVDPPRVDLRINGIKPSAGDVISNKPTITASVTDDVSGIKEVRLLIDSATPVPSQLLTVAQLSLTEQTRALAEQTLAFMVPAEQPLAPGDDHYIKIEAVDYAGNIASESFTKLKVVEPTAAPQVLGVPLSYPAVFSPEKEVATLAYQLNVDTDVTIYMYDMTAQLIWQRNYSSGSEGGRGGYNKIEWDGITDFKEMASNGTYIYKVVSRGQALATGRVAVLR